MLSLGKTESIWYTSGYCQGSAFRTWHDIAWLKVRNRCDWLIARLEINCFTRCSHCMGARDTWMALKACDLYLNQWERWCLGILIDMSWGGFMPCTFCCYWDIDVTFLIWISFDQKCIKMESQSGHNLVNIVTAFATYNLI